MHEIDLFNLDNCHFLVILFPPLLKPKFKEMKQMNVMKVVVLSHCDYCYAYADSKIKNLKVLD